MIKKQPYAKITFVVLFLLLFLQSYAMQTELHQAAKDGDLKKVKALVGAGAKLEARDHDNWTPLYMAANRGHLKIIEYLVDHGADIEARDVENSTPLHWTAAWEGHLEVVKVLVGADADIDAKNSLDQTPLHLAAKCGSLETITFLIFRGANSNELSKYLQERYADEISQGLQKRKKHRSKLLARIFHEPS